MNKYFLIIIFLLVVFLALGLCLSKRRVLPFQEVIALDKGIAVVNAQQWYIGNLQVSCRKDGREIGNKKYNYEGFVIFPGLENDRKYTIQISRTDIKGKFLYKPFKTNVMPHKGGDKYYILIGASIGKKWDFCKLPERLNQGKNIVFGNRTVYQFDKSKAVENIVQLPFPVSGVILKECSSYFPRNLKESEKDLISWGRELKQKGIQPFFATTVPVTAQRDHKAPGRQKSLEEFNDFIRQYGKQEGLSVIDLEKALRCSTTDRHLKDNYAQEDGTHLVDKAYQEALDPLVFPELRINISGKKLKK
jgi:hypothetical protein